MRVPVNERRISNRVPIDQPAVVQVRDRDGAKETHTIQTVDMSSKGLLFECEHEFPIGKRLEVSVLWPVKLDNGCDLKLWAVGRVVRRDGKRTAVAIEKQELRTAGRTFAAQTAA